jgi:fibronectin-binding autotransporter adhesin
VSATLASLLLITPAAAQQTRTWDANGATAGTGGTGTWNTTLVLWDNAGSLQSWNNGGVDNAIFGGTAGTVTLGVPITAHNLNFLVSGYTIAGSTLTLGGATPTISLTTGTTTISSAITGSAGLITTGFGSLTLSGVNSYSGGLTLSGTGTITLSNSANTYTGATTINSGTLQLSGGANRMPTSTDVVIANTAGATLNLNGNAQTVASLSGGGSTGGTVTLGSGTLTINKTSDSSEFAGVISGTGGLTKSGAGTQVLTGANTYSGATTINAGTLQIGNGGTTGSVGPGSIANSGSVVINRSDTLVMANVISGTGTLTQAGSGTTVLTGASTYTGTTTISAGTLQIGNGGATGALGTGAVTNNGALVFNRTVAQTVANVIGGTGTLTQAGTGTISLTGTNTYSGATIIGVGSTLSVGNGGATGTLGASSGVTNDGTLQLNRTGTLTVTQTISGTGALTKLASGTAILTGNNTYSGTTTISGGTLQIGSGGTTGILGAGAVVNNATLSFNRSNLMTVANGISGTGAVTQAGVGTTILTGANTYSGTTTISSGTLQIGNGGTTGQLGTGNITNNASLLFNRSNALTVANVISGAGSVTQVGTGTTILTGANTYTGTTTIAAGTLQIGNGGSTGSLATGSAIANSGRLVFNRSNALTFANAISGGGSVTQGGTGTISLSGTNTYSGTTTISAGILSIGAGSTTGDLGNSANVVNNATLQINRSNAITLGQAISGTGALSKIAAGTATLTGTNTYSGTTTITGGTLEIGNGGTTGTLGSGDVTVTSATLRLNRSDTLTLDQVISGTGSLTQVGGGTSVLAGANTYSGTTTISAGALQVGSGGTTGQLGTGNVTNNASLLFNRNNALSVANVISGSGGVTQAGTGTTTLTGANTYTGTTTISAGTLQIGNGGATGALGTGAVTNNGALVFNRTVAQTVANVIGGTGTLTQAGTGTISLTGGNSYSGTTTVSAGILRIGAGSTTGTLGTADVSVDSGATLAFNRRNAYTVSNTITGAGTLSQIGSGTTTLTSASNDVAITSVTAGTLDIDSVLTTTALTMGSGVLNIDGIVQAGGGGQVAIGSVTGGASMISVNLGATLFGNGDLGDGTDRLTAMGTVNTAGGTIALGDGNDRLRLHETATVQGIVDAGAGSGDRLTLAGSGAGTFDVAQIGAASTYRNFEEFRKDESGTWTLVGTDVLSLGWTILAGTLIVDTSSLQGNVTDNADLRFDQSAPGIYAGVISGSGVLSKLGAGTLTLTGVSTYTGATTVAAGTLIVDGALGNTSLTVATGSTLGGVGTIAGAVTVDSGATIAPGLSPGTLTVGSLSLASGAVLNYELATAGVAGSGINDLIVVTGDLTLDGTLNVAGLSGFGVGTYRLFDYGGALTDNVLAFGTMPIGFGYQLETVLPGQVNLLVALLPAPAVQSWDGGGASANGGIDGGSGVWSAGATNWTNAAGTINHAWGGNTAVFGGPGGTVTVQGAIDFRALDFRAEYALVPDAGGSFSTAGEAIIRADAGVTATIDVPIMGNGGLNIQGPGTVVLSGINTYAGGTTINAGTLAVRSDANLGDPSGPLTLMNNGTLHTSADMTSFRAVTLGSGGGRFDTFTGTTLVLAGKIEGPGSLTKVGAGRLELTGNNTYSGNTNIYEGTISISSGGNLGTGALVLDGGTLQTTADLGFGRATTLGPGGGTFETLDGTTFVLASDVDGVGSLVKTGHGSLTLTGANNYAGGTLIRGGTLLIGDCGYGGSVAGPVSNDGMLTFNRADLSSFGNPISGGGAVSKECYGTVVLTGHNSYRGGTFINRGTLSVSSDANLGAAAGRLSFDGGTLQTTADMHSSRMITLEDRGGIFEILADTTFAVAGDVGGSGALTKVGSGRLLLTGTGSYSGGTTIRDGALQIGNCGTTGSLSGDVSNLGALVFSRSDANAFQGSISGTGVVVKGCDGTLVLTGVNSYTGGTLVTGGTLQGDTVSLQGEIANNAAVVFDQMTDGVFRGTLFGSGTVTKIGTGTLFVQDAHYVQGVSTVREGTLSLTGSLAGGVVVKTGAILNATGAIGGSLVVDGTVVVPAAIRSVESSAAEAESNEPATPGGALGGFAVVGDVVFRPGSRLRLGIDAAGNNSALVTSGYAIVGDRAIEIDPGAGSYGRVTHYALLHATRGVVGSTSATSTDDTLEPYLSQSDSMLFATVLRMDVPLARYAISAAGAAIAGSLDRVKGRADGDLRHVIRELTALDDERLGGALDMAAGEIHASAGLLASMDAEGVADVIRGEISNRVSARARLEGDVGSGELGFWATDRRRTWLRMRAERSSVRAEATHGARADLQGITLGADWVRRQQWLVGIGASYVRGHLLLGARSQSARFAAPRAVAYLGYAGQRWGVDAGMSVAHNAYDIERVLRFVAFAPTGQPLFGGIDRTASSHPSGVATDFWGEGRIDALIGGWNVLWSSGVRRAHYGVGGWTEAGAEGLSLSGSAGTLNSTQADSSLRFARTNGRFLPFLSATYRRELTAGRTRKTLQIGDTADGLFEVDGLGLPRDTTVGEAGFRFLNGSVGMSVWYEVRRARQQTRHVLQFAFAFD